MGTSWTAKTLPPHLADTSQWRTVDVDALDDPERGRFLKYHAAIEAYLRSGKISAICAELGLAPSSVLRQLNRCTTLAEDGKPLGWVALIAGHRKGSYERKADLPNGRITSAGSTSGAFTAFMLSQPNIKQKIDNLILKRRANSIVHEARISLKNIHAAFVSCCEKAGITGNQYPLNSKSRARRSIERYVTSVLLSCSEEACRARFGAVAHSHLKVGSGRKSVQIATAPYDVVGIDPHKMDCIGSVRITGPKGPQRVAIERLWIVPALDDYSRAILGYSVGIRTECSAATIEQCIISAMSMWEPRKLKVPTMVYGSNAGLPSGRFPELTGRAWAALMVDNAAVHYAQAIAERARRRLGCAVNYGPVGHWEHRPALERVMETLEAYGFQRLPSTVGSGPLDPAKSDPVGKAIGLGIDWELLLDLIDVVIANYNATPNEALGNRSPLSLLHDYVAGHELGFLPRRLPPPTAAVAELGVTIETRAIRGTLQEGRRPYIEIDRVHYTSPILSSSFGLIGKQLRVHIRESNMCSVIAYHESGEVLGRLQAQGPWGQTVHTREMRKQINALRDSGELVVGYDENPVVVLLNYLGSEAYKEAEKKPMKISRSATRLVRASAASGLSVASDNGAAPAPEVEPVTTQEPAPPSTPALQPTPEPAAVAVDSSKLARVPGADKAETPKEAARPLSVLVKPPQWKTVIR